MKTSFLFLKRSFLQGLVATLLFSCITIRVISAPPKHKPRTGNEVKNIVLVHGAFADGSGFKKLYSILTKKGYHVKTEGGILPPDEHGVVYFDKAKFHAGFAADLSMEEAGFMSASQVPIFATCFGAPVTEAAWKTKPSYGIVATEDKALNPDIERNMYKRAGAAITEIKGSHVVFMSQAEAVANVIIKAANGSN